MEDKQYTVEIITTFTPEIAEQVRDLAKQIGANYKTLSDDDIKAMLKSSCNRLIVVKSGNDIVGMVTLLVFRIPYVKKAYLDDLVVDEAFRGQGFGKLLLEKAVAIAKEEDAAYVDFTSRPRRVAGNTLYEKLGFKKRDTNVYRLNLSYEEI